MFPEASTAPKGEPLARSVHLRVAAFWSACSLFSTLALFPYVLDVLPRLREALAETPLPLPVVAAIQGIQAALFMFALGYAGLRVGEGLGLGSPLVTAWAGRGAAPPFGRSLAVASAVGLGLGLAVVTLDHLAFEPMMSAPAQSFVTPARWKGLLASFYGGIVEELQFRLFLMTLFAWALRRVFGARGFVLPASALASALAFAAAHLPAAAMIWPLGPAVVARVILLNLVVALPLGLLYARRGLEHAVAAHFCADLALHVLGAKA